MQSALWDRAQDDGLEREARTAFMFDSAGTGSISSNLLHEKLLRLGFSLSQRALDSPRHLERVRRHSYSHPNGFKKVVLAAGNFDECELRVHFWDAALSTDRLKVHDHAWDLFSCVVSGALRLRQFAVRDGNTYVTAIAEPYEHEGEAYQLSAEAQRCDIGLLSEHVLAASSFYMLPAASLHVADPVTAPTITLASQGPFRRPACRVLFSESVSPQFCVATRQLDADQVRTILSSVILAISDLNATRSADQTIP